MLLGVGLAIQEGTDLRIRLASAIDARAPAVRGGGIVKA
jgi:hypothetical protein